MTDPTPAAMEKAREIVDAWFRALPVAKRPYLESLNVLYPSIARAIDEARKVPPGHIREGVTDRKWCNRDEFVSGRVDYLITRPKADNLITSVSWTPDTGYVPHTAAEAARKGGE